MRKYRICSVEKKVIEESVKTYADNLIYSDKLDFKKKLFNNLSNFLYVMIKNGFITEDYLEIINNFYGNPTNQKFIVDIMCDSFNLNYDLPLTDIDDVLLQLENIGDNVFEKRQALNYNLFGYFSRPSHMIFSNNESIFKKLVNTARKNDDGFLEEVVSREIFIYDAIVKKFSDINFDLSKFNDYKHFDDIFKNSRYKLNNENIKLIVKWLNENNSLYKIIDMLQKNDISSYVIDKVVKNISNNANVRNVDNNKLLNIFMKSNKIKPTTENLNGYFERNDYEINQVLLNFIENNEINLTESLSQNFYLKFVNENKISNDKYKKIMKKYNSDSKTKIDFIDISDELNDDKFEILFNLDIIGNPLEVIKHINNNNIEIDNVNSEYKKAIIDSSIGLNKTLLDVLLKDNCKENDLIISRNLDRINDSEIKNYLNNSKVEDNQLLYKVIEGKRIGNRKFPNTEFIRNFGNWLEKRKYISKFIEQKNGKIRLALNQKE